MSICSQDGCPAVAVKGGRCEAHPYVNRSRSPSSAVTGTSRWRRLKARVLREEGFVCYLCKGDADTVDHVRPVSAGGSQWGRHNLRACCTRCNLRKGARHAL